MKTKRRTAALLALAAVGCGGTTGGKLITLPFAAGGAARDSSQPLAFVTGLGWSVTLEQAQIVLGPLYFNVDSPNTAMFRSGVVIVQATEQFVVDALDPSLQPVPGGADGETGHAVSVEIGFYTAVDGYNDTIALPPPLVDPATGQGGTAYVAGTASKAGAAVAFAGRAQITGALVSGLDPIDQIARVAGAGCDLTFTAGGGALQLRVDPSRWFDQADFCGLVPAASASGTDGGAGAGADGGASDSDAGGGPCAPAAGVTYGWADSAPFNSALLGGMRGTLGVYDFSLSQPTTNQ